MIPFGCREKGDVMPIFETLPLNEHVVLSSLVHFL